MRRGRGIMGQISPPPAGPMRLLRQEAGMTIAAERPEARRGLTRRAAIGGGLALTLAGCNSVGVELPSDMGKPGPAVPPAAGPLVGQTMGSGLVRVGMILPLTQNGGASSPIGVSMRNAAQLAMDGFRSEERRVG